jgi:hypothetical protein
MIQKRSLWLMAIGGLTASALAIGAIVILGDEPGPKSGQVTAAKLTQQNRIEQSEQGGWTDRLITAPLPRGAAINSHAALGPIACLSLKFCVATGDYTDSSGNGQGLLVTGSGSSWTAHIAPVPPNAYVQPDVGLDIGSIACPGASTCIATGDYNVGSYAHRQGLLLTGSRLIRAGFPWGATAMPLPSGVNPTDISQLSSITCPTASRCLVSGSYTDAAGNSHGLLITGSEFSWSAIRAPQPADQWGRIACPAIQGCVATGGDYTNSANGHQDVVMLEESGNSWNSIKIPLPPNAAPAHIQNIGLGDVACASVSSCVAIGSYVANSRSVRKGDDEVGLLLTDTRGRWTAAKVLVAQHLPTSYSTTFDSVACNAIPECVIAGTYTSSSGYRHAMLVTESRAGWRAMRAPLPPGADPRYPSSVGNVVCSAVTCFAAGDYTDVHGYDRWMIITGSGTSWSTAEVPMPAGAKVGRVVNRGRYEMGLSTGGLSSAACPTRSTCVFTGSYTDSSGHGQALLLVRSATKCTATEPCQPASPRSTPKSPPHIIPKTQQSSPSTIPVVACHTSSGLLGVPPAHYQDSAVLRAPPRLADRLAYYTDAARSIQPILGPRGWACSVVIGGDGSIGIAVYPSGSSSDSPEQVHASHPSCVGCIATIACPLVPHVAVEVHHIGVPLSCSRPPQEVVTWISGSPAESKAGNDIVSFTDPIGVRGDGNPSGGRYAAKGTLLYSWGQTALSASEITCTLPASEADLCSSILTAFQHWQPNKK